MKEKETSQLDVELKTEKRNSNGDYLNLYIYIEGLRFELVPHCRTVKETAFFYSLLKKSKLVCAD